MYGGEHMPRSSPRSVIAPEMEYPDSDGQPMAESDFQRKPLIYLVEALQAYFANRHDVYVSGNLLIYYEEGNLKQVVSPDVFVVFGIPPGDRRVYQIWREGKGPDVVIEITSRATRRRDTVVKPALYARLGVQEYFQYDPTGDYLRPRLRGRVLSADGTYHVQDGQPLPGGGLSLESPLLGLELRLEAGQLRLFDPARGVALLTYQEERQARQEAERRVQELEAEIARLRAIRESNTSS